VGGASDCYPCEWNALLEQLPPRERVVVHEGWRVAHAFNTSLPGWLVLVPLRHVEAFAELSPAEATSFATLTRAASSALGDVVGCVKTYVLILGEEEGFAHLHAHVVPRMPDLAPGLRGTNVLELLGGPQPEWISEDERDRLALRLREWIEPALD
jgi:diadenosine tetraphosphate (Ap4A) HIT family hydrolase